MKVGPKIRMPFLLGMMLFAGFVLTSATCYVVSRNAIRHSLLENELPLSSNNIYSEIQKDLLEPILISSLMANDTFVKEWITEGEIDEQSIIDYLGHIQKKYGAVTSFLVSERTRKYYNAREVLKTVREEDPVDAWFFRVRKMATYYEINVDPDMSNRNAMTIFINYRVLDKTGKFLAATGVGLGAEAVKTLMGDYRQRYHRDVYFYDREGKLVLHSRDHDLSRHAASPMMRATLERISKGETRITGSESGENGALTNYRYIPELEWILVVEQDSDGTRGILLKTLGINLIVCLVTAVVLLGIIRKTALGHQRKLEAKNDELSTGKAKLQNANTARDKLFSIIGHDLRGPVGNVKSALELLQSGGLSGDEFEEIREDMSVSMDNILLALDNLMSWGAMQSRPLQSRVAEVNVRRATQECIELLGLISKRKGVLVSNLVPADADVFADPDQLQFVLRNLLSNAIKFTPGDRQVVFSAERMTETWRIQIRDEGIGMDAECVTRLLSQERASFSTLGTQNEKGFGLGFQLCIEFMQSNRGKLMVESAPDKGTSIYLDLPVAKR